MKFLTPKAVCDKAAISRATLDRLVASNAFPKPIRLTQRRLAFEESAVEKWMADKAEAA